MRPDPQHGFGVIAAISILVILAGLAAAIATVATTQHIGSALDLQGARAYWAARAGIELGLYQALKTTGCDAATPSSPLSTPLSLDTMAVTVECEVVATGSTAEAGLGTLYRITATACNLPSGTACSGMASSANYVERRLTGTVEKP